MQEDLAPIVLFVYNRPWHTSETLKALAANEGAAYSKLFVYCDGPKEKASEIEIEKIRQVREVVKNIRGFSDVQLIESIKNMGLARSIVQGVTEIVNLYGKVIVLEDDIITSKGFLLYMNEALKVYDDEERVMHVSGYMVPVKKKLPSTFFYNSTTCWGWATWKRAWSKLNLNAEELYKDLKKGKKLYQFNIDNTLKYENQLIDNINGQIVTWAIKWYASVFLNNGYCLHPYPSLVNNIGHDGSGENCYKNDFYSWSSLAEKVPVVKINISQSAIAWSEVKKFNKRIEYSILRSTLNRIKKLLRL